MKYGLHAPLFDDFAEPRLVAELAAEAEHAGWDGFFTWDHISPPWHPVAGDATVTLAAMAAATATLRLGPMVTALARRRPWKVAREMAALDRLSGGRMLFGAGVGGFRREFGDFGEEPDPGVRGAMLDEGLAILAGLWSGEPFSFEGDHYRVADQQFLPTPVQRPRIPVLLAATWPHTRPLERAARWDGMFPSLGNVSHEEAAARLASMLDIVRSHRGSLEGFEVFRGAETSGTDRAADREIVARFERIGATWWIENLNPEIWGGWDRDPWPTKEMFARVRQGPPR